MVAESQRRARPGRPKVVAEAALLDAAALLADDGGLESVTFRALAEVLGVSAMAVHRASGGIDALRHRLIAVVVDEAINDIAWPEGDWRAPSRRSPGGCATFCCGIRSCSRRIAARRSTPPQPTMSPIAS